MAVSTDVAAAPEIDAQVAFEVGKARLVLESMSAENVLASPYLASAVYYHDGFLAEFPVEKGTASPERRIIGQISSLLTAADKARFIDLLHDVWQRTNPSGPERMIDPVAHSSMGGGWGTHRYALDLFAAEGAEVRSVTRGVVVLADRDYSVANVFSTTSRKGGNAVIVFDPDHERFYRYCHLSTVRVFAGETVDAGEAIGAVGHTGLNASQAGHGRHLHFEVNEYLEGRVKAIDYKRLRAMLRQWRTSAALSGPAK